MWHKPETEAFCLQSKSCGFWKLLASAVAHNFYCGDERRSPFCMTRCHASLPLDKLELVSVCRQVSIFHSNLLVTKVFTRKSQSLFFGGKNRSVNTWNRTNFLGFSDLDDWGCIQTSAGSFLVQVSFTQQPFRDQSLHLYCSVLRWHPCSHWHHKEPRFWLIGLTWTCTDRKL